MGHISQSDGLIHILNEYPNLKKTLIHINNTNSIVDPNSENNQILLKNNIEVSDDNQDIYI